MTPRSVPQQWLHGVLDLCLLSLLARRRDDGLGLIQRLAEAGLGNVPGGTLYPAPVRLEAQGHVSGTWETSAGGPRRRYFSLTGAGRTAAADQRRRWHGFRDGIEAVVAGGVTDAERADAERAGAARADVERAGAARSGVARGAGER